MEHEILDGVSYQIFDDIIQDFSLANIRAIDFIFNEICKIRQSGVLILPQPTFGVTLDEYGKLVQQNIVAVRINKNIITHIQVIYENERYTSDNKKYVLCDEKYFAHYLPNGSNSPFIVKNMFEMRKTEFIVAINTILFAMQELKGNELHELTMFI